MEENSKCGAVVDSRTLRLRSAVKADASRIKEIERRCGLSVWTRSDYESIAENPNGILLVALSSATPVGFIYTRLITRMENVGSESSAQKPIPKESSKTKHAVEAELCNLGVLKEFRRNGVGTCLLRKTLLRLEEFSSFSVFLEVRRTNIAARAFYEKFGFAKAGVRPKYYRNPIEDAVVMRLER